MAKQIVRGFRGKMADWFDVSKDIAVNVSLKGPGVWDSCCFGLDSAGKLSDDRYMVFFNQLSSPAGEIVQTGSGSDSTFRVNLSKLPAQVDRLAFTVSLDGEGSVKLATSVSATLSQGGESVSLNLSGADFGEEKAVIAVEVYRKDSAWRLAAVASGFKGGLPALLSHYGGEEIAEPAPPAQQAAPPQTSPPAQPAPQQAPQPAPVPPPPPQAQPAPPQPPPAATSAVSLEKKLEQQAPKLLSLAKPLKVALEKHRLTDTVAMVGLVLDISGSMSGRFADGAVQDVINKTVPLAVQFDDDGNLDLWYYGTRPREMPPVTLANYTGAVPPDWRILMRDLGYGNNEPAVMKLVMDKCGSSSIPAYIVFITDGGIDKEAQIKKLLIEASGMPIFWQFVGLGGSGYGVLKNLDSMSGRVVDNANFFALDDFRKIGDEELYTRLLGEFPDWLKAAKSKGIL
ncbi:MAG: VWA domain-containing protein [Deltaproteobacteria bacterium]|jgi:stress response protein SCP2|nr:VWA domain-containing protein [Deltaproteobacteria bacterium]